MAFTMRCDTYNKVWDFSVDEEKDIARADTIEAVASVVGRKQAVRKDDSTEVANQKESQAQLFDEMTSYIMEMLDLAHYQASPWDMVRMIEGVLTYKHGYMINPKTVFASIRRPQAVLKTFRKFVQRSRLNNDKNEISKWKRALYLPQLYLARLDPYGFMSKIDLSSKSLSDNVRQSMAAYEDMFDTTHRAVDSYLTHLYQNGVLNLNTMGLDGITSELNDKQRTKVKIINEFMKGGEHGKKYYRVVDVNGEEHDIPATDIGMTTDNIKQAVIDKFKLEFLNDLVHGQARYLSMQVVPSETIVNKNNVTVSNPEYQKFRRTTGDGKKIDEVLAILGKGLNADNVFKVDAAGYEYTYVMIKSSEMKVGEKYNVYLLSKKSEETDEYTPLIDSGYDMSEYDIINGQLNHFTDGFFKSNEQGVRVGIPLIERDDNGNVISVTEAQDAVGKKVYENFNRIEKQPPMEIFDGMIANVPHSQRNEYKNLWTGLIEYRSHYRLLADEITKMANRELIRRKQVDLDLRRAMSKQGLPKEQQQGMLDTIYAIGGIKSYTWTDGAGQLHTLNSQFRHKDQNYGPVMWHSEYIDEMLSEQLQKLTVESQDTAKTEEELAILEEQISHFKELIYGVEAEELDEEKARAIKDSARALTTKNRVLWTDDTLRRKDGQVHKDHLYQTFSNLHSNRLTTDLVESIGNTVKVIPPNQMELFYDNKGLDRELIDYGINRVKIAQGDVDTKSAMSYEKSAEFFNALPFTGDNHDAESVRKLTLTVNGIMTMRYLGMAGAMGNLTQMSNDYIRFGGSFMGKAFKRLNDPVWEDIIANSGVLNIVNMFNDIMLSGGETELTTGDMGFYLMSEELLGVPVPSKRFFDWHKILRLSRQDFESYESSEFDDFIETMIRREKIDSTQRKDLEYVQRMEAYIRQNRKQLIRDKKGELHDVMTLSKEQQQDQELVEERMQKLLGRIADDKFKRMVSWKLSFFWGGEATKKYFTFTGTEETLRKMSVIMSLLIAGKSGVLGADIRDEKNRQLMYYTPQAVKIARDTVYATQFGMNQIYLPEIWEGIPRALLQYKSYPMFQMMHDYNVLQQFMAGNNHAGEFVTRLGKAMKLVGEQKFQKWFQGRATEIELQDRTVDRDAIMMLRFLSTRFMASILATLVSIIPFGNMLARQTGFGVPLQAIRSAENPAVGISFRLAAWAVLMGIYGDDDDDKTLPAAGRQLLFLTTPVLLMTLIRDLMKIVEKGGELWD